MTCDDSEDCAPASALGDGSSDSPSVQAVLPEASATMASDAAGDSGTSDSARDGAVPCIVGGAPSENGCIMDSSGVFVATAAKGGNDTSGLGTMLSPYATVSHAIAESHGATAIYVCGGSYVDQITVSGALNLYGGLTCAGHVWAYSGDAASVPVVTGSTPSFTLEVNALAAAVHVDDMAFRAPDANAADLGESSIAVWVNASTNVTFQRVTMTSGAGAMGATGSSGDDWADASAPMGANATGGTGGASVACPCGSSIGGGGNAGVSPGSGTSGGPVVDGGTGGDGLGGVFGSVTIDTCSNGNTGATAPDEGGGSGEDAGGTLSTSGWDGGGGGVGTSGGVGQGGGGGSGGRAAAASGIGGGSAGGCGGCGGG
jgi:uncharacterized membrane protein YgcG